MEVFVCQQMLHYKCEVIMMHTKDLTNCPHVEPASTDSQVIRPTMVEVYFPEKDKTLPY